MNKMEKGRLPKVMSLSLNTWRADSGIHTETDLFKFWEPNRVAQIYTRSDLPDTPVCDKFYQISENAVLHSVFNRKPAGHEVANGGNADAKDEKAIVAEQKLYKFAHKRKSWVMTLAREIVWSLGKWKTDSLDKFVGDFDADVYFVPVYPVIYTAKIQQYILKKFPKPYVCFMTDDNYSYEACGTNIFSYIHRFFLRRVVRNLIENCNEIFTITNTEARDTDRLFRTHSVVLTKGIDYSKLTFSKKEIKEPVRMVYTGKLLIGRAYSLVEISKALKNINKDGQKVTLEIYSPTVLDKKTMQCLNENGCTFKGAVPKSQVDEIQRNADIVVFVESLERKYRKVARLSFSTKLTDYFASGKCIFAIGDENIAPIEYLRENDAAIIATDYSDIQTQLKKLIDNKEIISEYGKKAFECGKKNHEEKIVKKTFIETICKAVDNA